MRYGVGLALVILGLLICVPITTIYSGVPTSHGSHSHVYFQHESIYKTAWYFSSRFDFRHDVGHNLEWYETIGLDLFNTGNGKKENRNH